MFKAKDKVYLNNKNIKSMDYKYYELFEIEKSIGKQVYQLKLSKKMKIYDVFYVSLLNHTQKQMKATYLHLHLLWLKKRINMRLRKFSTVKFIKRNCNILSNGWSILTAKTSELQKVTLQDCQS